MDIVEKVEKFMRDNNLVQYYDLEASHKYEVEDSFNTGKNEGIQEGIQRGKNEGRNEGRNYEKISIAKNLLKDHLDINKIMQYTGLTKQEILDLQ